MIVHITTYKKEHPREHGRVYWPRCPSSNHRSRCVRPHGQVDHWNAYWKPKLPPSSSSLPDYEEPREISIKVGYAINSFRECNHFLLLLSKSDFGVPSPFV